MFYILYDRAVAISTDTEKGGCVYFIHISEDIEPMSCKLMEGWRNHLQEVVKVP